MRKILFTAIAFSTLALTACGSSKSSSSDPYSGPSNPSSTPAPNGSALTVKATTTSLGQILVDAQGRTLYAFTNDVDSQSSCTGSCATIWPPAVVTGNVVPDKGLAGSEFSLIDRPDGTKQLAAGKWPLYTYAGDAAPGDTNGQGSGGTWFVVGTDAKLVKA
jgi:predicted lipoprotein with Yx(FWY)xxD motif